MLPVVIKAIPMQLKNFHFCVVAEKLILLTQISHSYFSFISHSYFYQLSQLGFAQPNSLAFPVSKEHDGIRALGHQASKCIQVVWFQPVVIFFSWSLLKGNYFQQGLTVAPVPILSVAMSEIFLGPLIQTLSSCCKPQIEDSSDLVAYSTISISFC